jgi:anti-sigma factor RsiW
MNHERYEELAALALYGELDADERAELATHVAGCARCAELRDALRAGLGRLREDPADRLRRGLETFDAGLRRRVAREARAERVRALLPVLAFAAGVLATWLALRGPAETVAPAKPARELASASPWQRFHGSTPPPAAASSGSLAQLSSWLRR